MTPEEIDQWFKDWHKRCAVAWGNDDAEEEEWLKLEMEFKVRELERLSKETSDPNPYQPTGWYDEEAEKDADA